MKMQMLIGILTILLVIDGYSGAIIKSEAEGEPAQVIETAEKLSAATVRGVVSGVINSGDRLLHRNYYSKTPLVNAVQSQDITYRSNSSTRVSYVSAFEVGYTQYAIANITAGGPGWNTVTVRLTSARGYGYYFLVEIWGR